MRVIKLYEGITYNSDTDEFDIKFNGDSETDIIHLTPPTIYKSDFLDNTYYFGYKFADNCSSMLRSKFIHWIKGLTEKHPSDYQYRELIAKPLKLLDKEIGLRDIKMFVYPRSNRSELVQKMIEVCGIMMQRDTEGISVELIKSIPENVKFNWTQFRQDFDGDTNSHQFHQIYDYIENELMPKIHSLEYFSIAENVKPKYRQYIKDYLTVDSGWASDMLYLIKSNKILIVDDINTSGATLSEILRIIRNVNTDAEIYIFTLIGNAKEDN